VTARVQLQKKTSASASGAQVISSQLPCRTERLTKKREREREMREVVRDTTFRVRKTESIFPVLKIPRQCPLVLLVEASNIIGIRFYLFI
jgi:hypothetical protein